MTDYKINMTAACTVKSKVADIRSAISSMHQCASSVNGCKREEVANELRILVRSCNRLVTLTGRMSDHDKERKMEAIMYCQKIINKKIQYV